MFKTDTNTPVAEIGDRISKLQASMQAQDIEGALILQNCDLFYFAGTIQQSHLFVPDVDAPILMTRKSFARAQAESPLAHIVPLASPKKLPEMIKAHLGKVPLRIGMELDVLPANLYLMYQQFFDGAQIIDISTTIRKIRAVKSEYELSIIAQAARYADRVAAYVKTVLKEGITEIALAGLVEAYARQLGHQGLVRMRLWGSELFYGHLMAGASAAVPSYLASPTGGTATSPAVAQGPGFASIRRHEPVLVDYVFALNGYIADHTRIFSIGPLPDDLMAAHDAMCRIQESVKSTARPGVTAGEIYDLCVANAADAGYGEHFMGVGPQRIRFVGHGIGLELDEFPFLAQGQKMALETGMVIALEPKLIFPGRGVVGIENTHVVTDQGLKQITKFPDEITVLT